VIAGVGGAVAGGGVLADGDSLAGELERDGPLDGPGSAVAGLPGTQDLLGVFYRGRARGYAIHDAIMNDAGLALMTKMMSVAAAPSVSRAPGRSPASAFSCSQSARRSGDQPGQQNRAGLGAAGRMVTRRPTAAHTGRTSHATPGRRGSSRCGSRRARPARGTRRRFPRASPTGRPGPG
jgi:hypothetical protein